MIRRVWHYFSIWNYVVMPAKKSRVLIFWWSRLQHWWIWQLGRRKVPRHIGAEAYDFSNPENLKGLDMTPVPYMGPVPQIVSVIPTLHPENYPTILPPNWEEPFK